MPSYLEMLERQTLKDFEVIIVDDGSTDGLAEAVAAVHTSYDLRYIRFRTNRGANVARNAGIDDARGRYIALLDSDDAWHPDKLRRQFDQLEAAEDRDRLVSLSRQIVSTGRQSFIAPRFSMHRNDRVGTYLFQRGGVLQSSTMFLTSDLAKLARFPEGEKGHDDWTFALRLEALGARFDMLPDPLVYYCDDDRPDRRGRRSPSSSLGWLERHRSLLGDKAYFAASAAFGSRMHGEVAALRLITQGFGCGAVSPWRSAYYLATWACPPIRRLGIYVKHTWLMALSAPKTNS